VTATITVPEAHPSAPTADRAAERWGVAAYLAAVTVLVVAVLVLLRGTFVYVLDDAAIHLSMADTLARHGTWGVTPGAFESASSSPLWTVLVAAGLDVLPMADAWVPLVLNVVAGVAVVVVLLRNQTVLRPGRARALDAAVVVVLVTLVLFLPGLSVVGMEHTLHMALVLGAVVAVQRAASGGDRGVRLPGWLPYALLALAALARFETAFVGLGLAAGLACQGRLADGSWLHRRRQIAGVLAAVAVPVVLFALGNVALGGGLLPNSLLAKGQGVGADKLSSGGIGPGQVIGRLGRDPLLLALVAFALGYVVLTWGRAAPHLVTAVTLVVAALLHATLADVGWFERYQAYLLAVGAYLVLGVIGELPADTRRRGVVALLVLAVLLTPTKALLLARAPQWSDDTYRHTYQAGRFLGRYYDGRPVATDQLGYISLFHDGPLTDFAGLGDYEVLQRIPDRARTAAFRGELADERGFRVVVLPSVTAAFGVPDSWVLAGRFRIEGSYQGFSRSLDVWAAVPGEVTALQDHLREFARDLPARVTIDLNGFAEMQAAAVRGS
jgi:hypothetical protein